MDMKDLLSDNKSGSTDIAIKLLSLYEDGKLDNSAVEYLYNAFSGMGLVRNIISRLRSGDKVQPHEVKLELKKEEESAVKLAVTEFPFKKVATISAGSMLKKFVTSSKSLDTLYILESRPMLEGSAMAKELKSSGIRAIVLTDASMCVAVENANAVIVGSDSILGDMTLIHKIGTFPLALCARRLGKPFISLSISMKYEEKFTYNTYPGFQLHSCNEIAEGIDCINKYFDKTPRDLIDYIVMEDRIMTSKSSGI
ncbi:translation initiation factor eIF2 beta subunit [Thermoplasma volcanium GSS1]|uniref:Translation initiation factor eIF2 beta subunit n=1 Tax=Thermoplasma volcanium (strain ATCC 51530 / DSM 4299 / JCM 9571 / NBRC 15438 / GSS1) TaxID=273116 RepID=Q97A32_THEVO|nr:translation initiation factor IF-2B subunit delta [Thermoplasma volcanium]BAB60120.1 translation initiation factor eIF2 beta subunit [Thermoplasma volcanium GSS1]